MGISVLEELAITLRRTTKWRIFAKETAKKRLVHFLFTALLVESAPAMAESASSCLELAITF